MSIDIGRVMSSTFSVIGRYPVVFLGLSFLVAGLPYGIVQFFALNPDILVGTIVDQLFDNSDLSESETASEVIGFALAGFMMFLVYFLLALLLQAMLVVATVRDMSNQDVSIRMCLTEALNRVLPLIGLAFLSLLGIMLGLMLLIVPGIILMLMWIVAVPVMLTENLGAIESLKRSAELTSGSKGMIFLLVIIFMFGSGAMSGMAEGAAFINSYASVGMTIVAETVVAAVQAAGVAALFIELRTIKDGPLTDALSDVFA